MPTAVPRVPARPRHPWIDRACRAAGRLDRRVAGGALAFAALPVAWNAYEIALTREPGEPDPWPMLAASALAVAAALVPALLVADAAVDDGVPRWRAYAAAAAIATAAAFGLLQLLAWGLAPWLALQQASPRARLGDLLQGDAHWIVAITAFHASRRGALAARTRVNRLQLQHARERRQALEHRLDALQARVDPQFLVGALERIGRLHAGDAPRATGALDALVDWLRAAMPPVAPAPPTLSRELALATAYLRLRQAMAEPGAFTFEVDAGQAPAGRAFAPLLLVPMLETLLCGAGLEDARGRVSIMAREEMHGVRLSLTLDGASPAGDAWTAGDRLATLQARVGPLLGERARLGFEPHGAGRRLVLEWAHEQTDRHPR